MTKSDTGNIGIHCKEPGALETVTAIARGTLSARQALEDRIAALEARNGAINAVVVTDLAGARRTADEIDTHLAAGAAPRPLEGLPMTVKEVFDVDGMPTSWGDPALAGNVPGRDAGVCRALKQAGAVIFGKTNLPERMADWESDNRQWGPTRNPWDTTLSAGGSSGGSAAAVAAGITSACIGSDMGGSIRMPAHYCGVFAHNPTWGLVSMTGHSLIGEIRMPDMCVAGPLTRRPEDLSLLLSVLAVPEPVDGIGWDVRLPEATPKPLSELRLGALLDHTDCPVDSAYGEAMAAFITALRDAGVTVEEGALPDIDFSHATDMFNLLARAETSTMLDDAAFSRAGADVGEPGHRGRNARGNTLLHRDWLRLHEERLGYREKWADYFTRYDGFLSPVASACAQPLLTGPASVLERTVTVNGRAIEMTDQHFWAAIPTLPYLPAVTLPVGLSRDGLPAGMQLVGPAYRDHTMIAMAGMLTAPAS